MKIDETTEIHGLRVSLRKYDTMAAFNLFMRSEQAVLTIQGKGITLAKISLASIPPGWAKEWYRLPVPIRVADVEDFIWPEDWVGGLFCILDPVTEEGIAFTKWKKHPLTLCELVQQYADVYWQTSPDTRSMIFKWLDDHALECDPCALFLERAIEKAKKHP